MNNTDYCLKILGVLFASIFLARGAFAENKFDILVNDDTHQAEQINPRVAVNFAGEFVVVWEDKRNGRSEIFFQYFDSTGNELGGNQRISGTSTTAPQYGPELDANQLGQFGAVWSDYRNGSYPFDPNIYYSSIDMNGPGQNNAVTDSRPDSTCESPDIAVLPSGNIIIVWADYRDKQWNIYGQLLNSGGTAIGSNFIINSALGNSQQHSPRVATLSDGRFVAVWYDNRLGNDDIYGRIFNADGSALSADFRINDDDGTAKQAFPVIAADGNERFFVAWVDWRNGIYPKNPDIYYRRYNAAGIPIDSSMKIISDADGKSQKDVAICADRMGNLGIVWSDSSSGNWDAMARIVDYSGDAAVGGFLIHQSTAGRQLQPDVATDGYKFYFVWADSRNGDFDIYVTIKEYNDPTIVSTPNALSFTMEARGTLPASQSVQLTNAGYGELNWSASSASDWISVNPSSGTTPVTMSIQINTDTLSYGTYVSQIRLTDTDHNDSSEVISVLLKVTAPIIDIDPDTLYFKALAELGNPDDISLQIRNSGSGSFNWSASEFADWLDINRSSGSSGDYLAVSIELSGLQYGQYLAPLIIESDEAVNSPETAWVSLDVTGNIPYLKASPDTLIIKGGAGDILSGQIEISNPGSGVLNWTAVESADWLSLNMMSGTDFDTINAIIDNSILVTGSYSTNIIVYDGASFNQQISIPVYLYLSSDDTLQVLNSNALPDDIGIVPIFMKLSNPAKAIYIPFSYDPNSATLDSIIPNADAFPEALEYYSSISSGTAEFGFRFNANNLETEIIPAGSYLAASLFFTTGETEVFNHIDTLTSDSSGMYTLNQSLNREVPAFISGDLIIGNPTALGEQQRQIIPENVSLSQNYPNPFNSSTFINVNLNKHARVSMKIYNLLGQTVYDYGELNLAAGSHRFSWDGSMTNSSHTAPSGIYFYSLRSDGLSFVKKMVLLK